LLEYVNDESVELHELVVLVEGQELELLELEQEVEQVVEGQELEEHDEEHDDDKEL
jgi:hypothetical protein